MRIRNLITLSIVAILISGCTANESAKPSSAPATPTAVSAEASATTVTPEAELADNSAAPTSATVSSFNAMTAEFPKIRGSAVILRSGHA